MAAIAATRATRAVISSGSSVFVEPGVARPRPPQRRQDEQPAAEPLPRRVFRHEGGDLREAEDEDEVEEQLERGYPLLTRGHRRDLGFAVPVVDVGTELEEPRRVGVVSRSRFRSCRCPGTPRRREPASSRRSGRARARRCRCAPGGLPQAPPGSRQRRRGAARARQPAPAASAVRRRQSSHSSTPYS